MQGLRSADVVMAPWRAAAATPTPLSFSRSLVRKMVAERWRITRTIFELDDEGRGEALYRVEAPQIAYHFVGVSDVFPPDQKIDRAFGINWDVSAALCEGAWTDERRAMLVEEVPKQYDGRYPADVICFCRGNRSERIFDHVVDALASGAQPDTALLASVGYLLRSTAFAGNGLFGMKPFEAFDRTHPLGATYHAQILAAYLLRIFVFDLVEHIAAARSAAAARLDPAIKRYLGLGNSAGLGLVPFIMNHPRIIHQWCFAQEGAFAEALDMPAEPGAIAAFGTLLDKASTYFRQDQRDGNGIFADNARLAAEFEAMRAALDRIAPKAPTHWRAVCDAILPLRHHPETAEALLGLLLELFPDIVARWDTRLVADESADVDPTMTVEQLAILARESYGWLLDDDSRTCPHFWYYPLESPYEPRRGLRGTGTSFETETSMDLPRLLPRLLTVLAAAPGKMPVGVFLARHPEFALLAQRVQSLAGLDYAELRVDSLAADYLPFAACRFLLAFYGMEKYDPRLPRSTKGALLQGAPLPEDIAHGIEGDWPFPLTPEAGKTETPVIVPQRLVEQPEIAIGTLKPLGRRAPTRDHAEVTVLPAEMRKLLTRAAFGAGLDAAAADAALRLALLVGEGWIDGTLATLDARVGAGLRCDGHTIEGTGLPDFAIAPAVLDLAGGLARSGVGQALGAAGAPTPLLDGVALWGAERGFLTAVADAAAGTLMVAGGSKDAVWCGICREMPVERAAGTLLAPVAQALASLGPTWSDAGAPALSRRFAVFCMRQPISWAEAEPALAALGAIETRAPVRVAEIRRRAIVEGVRLSPQQFQHLSRLAKRGLVPPEIELVLTGQASAAA
jgi:hypothetical protein